MALKEHFFSFVRKYGAGAKFVGKAVLNVAAPGSGALVELFEKACDTAQQAAHDNWEDELLKLTQKNTAELYWLGEVLALLQADMARLCDKANAFADQPDAMEDIVRRALASDSALVAACGKLDHLTGQFACVVAQNQRLLDGQSEMIPILRRLNRVLDFFEECVAAQIQPRDIAEFVKARQYVVKHVYQRQTTHLGPMLTELHNALPKAASIYLLDAGIAVVEHDSARTQQALAAAVKLKPSDGEIVALHSHVTTQVIKAAPRQPSRAAPGITPSTATDVKRIGGIFTNALGMTFAWVPPGRSWLGGGGNKPGTKEFCLPSGLWCGVYQVTQAEWLAVMNNNPSPFKGNPRYPVGQVSWDEVQEFLRKLNARLKGDRLEYGLPTEEEWEYICRGGPLSSPEQSKYHFYIAKSKTDPTPVLSNDLSSRQANFDGNYPAGSAAKEAYLQRPCDVGSYLPNSLGIYDMHGNIWEWTASVHENGSDRVIRGGGWNCQGSYCQAARRSWLAPALRNSSLGFRLTCSSDGK